MKKLICCCTILIMLGGIVLPVMAQPDNFPTSLHATRAGKNFWYGAENGGFENFTNVPIEELGCVECHGPTDANGNAYPDPYSPDCTDCHPSTLFPVSQDQCLSCHGRQKTEMMALGYSDVHRDMGFVCWDCHSQADIHGDGTEYNSMLEPGAIDADCENCHTSLPPEHASYNPHGGALHCTSCHAQTVISCYNCHFESQVDSHVKRAKQPIHDYVMLVNRDKDGKVYPATFQSLTYEGSAFVAFGPFTSHTITVQGRTCPDCHFNMGGTNAAIAEYNATGQIQFAQWDDDAKMLSWVHGIVPMPNDYETALKMDFLTYTGATTDPPPGDPILWTGIGKDTWDGHQMFFATPLTVDQMASLGMVTPTPVNDQNESRFSFRVASANPFQNSTRFAYTLPEGREVKIAVFDMRGRLVTELVSGMQPAGEHLVVWDASQAPSGVYFAKLAAGQIHETRRVTVVK